MSVVQAVETVETVKIVQVDLTSIFPGFVQAVGRVTAPAIKPFVDEFPSFPK
jgi:hypothetical protein